MLCGKIKLRPIYRRQDGPAVSSGHPCPAIGGKPSVSLRCARGAFVFPGQAPCGGAVPGFLTDAEFDELELYPDFDE